MRSVAIQQKFYHDMRYMQRIIRDGTLHQSVTTVEPSLQFSSLVYGVREEYIAKRVLLTSEPDLLRVPNLASFVILLTNGSAKGREEKENQLFRRVGRGKKDHLERSLAVGRWKRSDADLAVCEHGPAGVHQIHR